MAFDFDHAVSTPFRMQPGLRRLAPGAQQFCPNLPQAAHLREKLSVLTQDPHSALMQIPGFDAAPALQAVVHQLATEHPQAVQALPGGGLQARWLGCAVDAQGTLQHWPGAPQLPGLRACLQALPAAWRLPGLLTLAIEQDLAIVDGRQATLPWLAVALPSHWTPTDKLGLHFAQVHAPVADNRVLLAAGDHLLRLVCGPERWERFVWTLTPHAQLDQHPARLAKRPAAWPPAASPDELAALAWFRTEHQTFVPLPERQQAVFTIQPQTVPLQQVVDSPARAQALHDALHSMSQAVIDYRGLRPALPRLLAWLAGRAAC